MWNIAARLILAASLAAPVLSAPGLAATSSRATVLASAALGTTGLAATGGLEQDFSGLPAGQLPAGWTAVGGEWSVVDGRLRGRPESDRGETTLFIAGDNWRDVAVEIDLAFEQSADPARWCAIVARDGGSAPGPQLTVRRDAKRASGMEIATKASDAAGGWRVFQAARGPAVFEPGQVHRVRFEACGRWLRGYFDGKMVLRSPRGNEAGAAGRIGFRVSGATVSIDNLKVAGLEPGQDEDMNRFRTRPLVVAHRGFSWVAPENTLASYKLAMEAGAELAECDVYLTSDGVPVLFHDSTLERTTGAKGKVGDFTLAELKKLDAGKWKSPRFAGERIPTLEEVLRLVDGHLRLVIEIKEEAIAPQVLETIRKVGVEPDRLVVFSFHRRAVEEMGQLEPLVPTAWLQGDLPFGPEHWRSRIREARQARVSIVGLARTQVDPEFVRLAHESGLMVFVWTVNEPADMRYLIEIGVDAIITDRPDVLLDLLKR